MNSTEPTMSHIEIASLAGKRPDNVKRTMETLENKGLIQLTQIEEVQIEGGREVKRTVNRVNKRDSYVVMAQVSPEFTAKLVDRWLELEGKQQNQLTRKQLALMVVQAEEEKEEAERNLVTANAKYSVVKKYVKTKAVDSVIPSVLAKRMVQISTMKPITVNLVNKLLTDAGYQECYSSEVYHNADKGNGKHRDYYLTEKGSGWGSEVSKGDRHWVIWSVALLDSGHFIKEMGARNILVK